MQEKSSRRSNSERTETTRRDLLVAARRLFTEKGFAATGTPEIVEAAGVTRGALYHHFADKQALFSALFEQEAADVAAAIEAAAPAALEPVEALISGSRAYLEAMALPGRCRILLVEGPAVLGSDEVRRRDREHGEGALRHGLAAAVDAGAIAPLPLDALATQLSALLDRAALAIEQGDAIDDHMTVIAALFHGLAR